MSEASITITLMTDRSPRAAPHTHQIKSGDMLAKSGEWIIAIDTWQQAVAHDPRQRGRVEQRLHWLLRETHPRGSRHSSRVAVCIWGSAGTALIGVACILIADTPGTTAANVLAVTAWAMFIMSAVMTVVAARGNTSRDYHELLRLARANASRLAASQRIEDW
jgi:anti-sigma-K factor RskA